MADVISRQGIVSLDNNAGSLTAITADTAMVSGLGKVERTITYYPRGLSQTVQTATVGPLQATDITIELYFEVGSDNANMRDYIAWAQTASPTSRTLQVDLPATATGNDRCVVEVIPKSFSIGDLSDASSDPLKYTLVVSTQTTPVWSVQS